MIKILFITYMSITFLASFCFSLTVSVVLLIIMRRYSYFAIKTLDRPINTIYLMLCNIRRMHMYLTKFTT